MLYWYCTFHNFSLILLFSFVFFLFVFVAPSALPTTPVPTTQSAANKTTSENGPPNTTTTASTSTKKLMITNHSTTGKKKKLHEHKYLLRCHTTISKYFSEHVIWRHEKGVISLLKLLVINMQLFPLFWANENKSPCKLPVLWVVTSVMTLGHAAHP